MSFRPLQGLGRVMRGRYSLPGRALGSSATADIVAGISVAVVLIPQALAYAEIAGLPKHIGLYAAAIPPVVAAFFASSRYLQTGPVAITSLLTLGALSGLAAKGSPEYVKLAALLALVVGVVRIAIGMTGAGIIAYLMSQPVIIGFTSAASVLIIASQIPAAVGTPPDGNGLLSRAWSALTDPSGWDLVSLALAAISVLVIVTGRRLHRLFPGVLIVVVSGIAISELTGFSGPVVGTVPSGAPAWTFGFPWSDLGSLLVPGAVIALIGFAEAAAISRVFAVADRERWDPNREFISQGVANLSSAFSGGLPVGGSFSRSSIDRITGGRSRWSGLVTGLFVLAFLPAVSVLDSLPRAMLAAVVIAAVIPLIRLPTMFRIIRQSWGQSLVGWGTFAATLGLAPRVDLGVLVGIGLAVVVHLRREELITVTAHHEGAALVLRPSGVLFFGSAPRLEEALLHDLSMHPDTAFLTLDLARLGRVDYTGAVALLEFIEAARDAELEVVVARVPAHARGTLRRTWGHGTLEELEREAE